MAYLVRRLLENTSNEGFLKAKFSDRASAEALLRDPATLISRRTETFSNVGPDWDRDGDHIQTDGSRNGHARNGHTSDRETPPGDSYENAPLVNFVHDETQEKMQTALRDVRSRLGRQYPLVINGQKVTTGEWMPSLNPSNPAEVVGSVAAAGIPEAEQAVKAAREAFKTWCRVSVEHRAQLLERAAQIMDRRRYELSAFEVFEVGKGWAEADGDIREAIDFLLFTRSRCASSADRKLTQHVLGEESYQHYWPRACRS
jgi:RHH-type proline utilization regulon transcriptional repressor/proline dehydrogenase/delta 1-pyrroline-5-carboxylate dehydrogenase